MAYRVMSDRLKLAREIAARTKPRYRVSVAASGCPSPRRNSRRCVAV